MASVPPRALAYVAVLVSAFALSLSGELAAPAWAQQVTVTRVVDGDTVEISPAIDGNEDVRLIGVDTPETVDPNEDVQPYGPEATRFTTRELEGERVRLQFDEEREDQFGRLLAYVNLGGELFNERLLEQGYAQLYVLSPNDRYEARFEQAQQRARAAERGIWGLTLNQQCQLAKRGNGIGEGSPGCDRNGTTPDNGGGGAGGDLNCGDFDSQAQAQAEYDADTNDPNGLDNDGDREACEDFDYGANGGTQGADGDQGNADRQYGKDDVIPGTVKKGTLPGTGGPPLPIALWAIALVGTGIAMHRNR